jgi:CTP-dependent riboflavin kinase
MKWLRNLSLDKQNLECQGIVRKGRGGAVAETSIPGFQEEFKELFGMNVIPGTLDLKMTEPLDLKLFRYLKFADIGWDFDPATQGIKFKGEIGVYYRRATVAKKYPAYVLVFTWVTNLQTDAELISTHHLCTVLNLKEGDIVKFTLGREPQ